MSQANLARLPMELVEEIVSYLPDPDWSGTDAHPGFQDIWSLRLVCRRLDAQIRDAYYKNLIDYKRCFPRRMSQYETVVYATDPSNLLAFNAASKVNTLAASFRQIDYDCSLFLNDDDLKLVVKDCGLCEKMFLDLDWTDDANWLDPPDPFTNMCAHVREQDLLYEREWAFAATNNGRALLEAPFSHDNMINLKKIHLRAGHESTVQCDPQYWLLNPRPKQLCDSEHEILSHVTSTMIRILVKYNIDLTTFRVLQSNYPLPNVDIAAAGMWVLDQPAEILQAFKVRKLCLQLSNGTKGPTPAGWTKKRGYDILLRALDLLPNVETFSLAPPKYEVLEPDFISDLLQRLPQRVRRLFLHNFLVRSHDLRTFFSQRLTSLHLLEFTYAHLFADDEHWQPLLQFLHDQTPTIPDLNFGYLYEVRPTGYVLLSFPPFQDVDHRPLGRHHHEVWHIVNDCGPGRFDHGKYYPDCCGSLSHYVRLGGPGGKRYWRQQKSPLLEGLEYVLANISMDEYEWADRPLNGICYGATEHLPLQPERWVTEYWGLPMPEYPATVHPEYDGGLRLYGEGTRTLMYSP